MNKAADCRGRSEASEFACGNSSASGNELVAEVVVASAGGFKSVTKVSEFLKQEK